MLLSIQLIILMEEGRRIFVQVAQRVSQLSDLSQVLQCQQTRLQLKSFRIQKLLPEKAIRTYDRVLAKHKSPTDFNPKPDAWYESEKRLFVWFMTFYTYFQLENSKSNAQARQADSEGFPPALDFAMLSNVFFLKGADFLEFHWLVLLRSAEKVGWAKEEEQMLLESINQYGMRWNQISYTIFLKTNKTLFRAPKVCRQRWLNHLDNSKIKGEWKVSEDVAILQYVVQTKGKRWSKLVGVLQDRRTQHTIKNRFNAMIAKHRRYKMESDLKVAERLLNEKRKLLESNQLQAKQQPSDSEVAENQECFDNAIIYKEEAVSPEERQFQSVKGGKLNQQQDQKQVNIIKVEQGKFENQSLIGQYQKQKQDIINPLCFQPEVALNQQPCFKDQTLINQQIPQQHQFQMQFPPQVNLFPQEAERQMMFPFQTYSYEMEMYNQMYNMQQNQIIYYQMMTLPPPPTADTTSREQKLLEERRKRRPNPRKEE